MKTIPILAVGISLLSFGIGAVAAHAAAPSPLYSYDPGTQSLSVSLSDGSSFSYIVGTDALGNTAQVSTGGTALYLTNPGTFSDQTPSEWLITNDVAGGSTACTAPQYTGNPTADFASCIAAIQADGGSYEASVNSSPIMDLNYDPVGQVLALSLSDGSSFNFLIGGDQIGDGIATYNGTPTYSTAPGIFGDSLGSEWIITNDPAGGHSETCPMPTYTGNPAADFASCIAAINADGGTYELAAFGIVGGGNNAQVFMGAASAAQLSPDGTLSLSGAQPGGSGHMSKNGQGFVVAKGSVFTSVLSPKVPDGDKRFMQSLINAGILKPIGSGSLYKLTQKYIFPSPSLVADLIAGVPVNGWNTWKTTGGQTLGSLYKHD